MEEIKPLAVYTTTETQKVLRISESTMKRLIKRGAINANKVGGQYRILGKELLRLVSPKIERRTVEAYQRIKKDAKIAMNKW